MFDGLTWQGRLFQTDGAHLKKKKQKKTGQASYYSACAVTAYIHTRVLGVEGRGVSGVGGGGIRVAVLGSKVRRNTQRTQGLFALWRGAMGRFAPATIVNKTPISFIA